MAGYNFARRLKMLSGLKPQRILRQDLDVRANDAPLPGSPESGTKHLKSHLNEELVKLNRLAVLNLHRASAPAAGAVIRFVTLFASTLKGVSSAIDRPTCMKFFICAFGAS